MTLLRPSDVMTLWPVISVPLLFGLPPLASAGQWTEERVLFAVNQAQLNVWVYSEKARILAVITTTITGDVISGSQSLLVYTAHGVEALSDDDWQAIYDGLATHCRRAGINRIVAFSDVDRVIEIFEKLGGVTAQRLCELAVPKE